MIENESVIREKTIVRTSLVCIGANVVLAAIKVVIGAVSRSVVVTLDAVNNIADALSSIVAIIGTKLSGKAPNKEHPLGYGRIEYISSAIVSALVLYAGITALIESVKKIIHPEVPDYSTLSLVILAIGVVVKLIIGNYAREQGRKVSSTALEASGTEGIFDAIISASVLASALILKFFGISLEPWVGAVISLFIIKSGAEMMAETANDIIGSRWDVDAANKIKELIREYPAVRGAYDLTLHSYGPNRSLGSVHIELPDTMTVAELDTLTRRIMQGVYEKTGVLLTGISVYSYNTHDDEAAALRDAIYEKVKAHDWVIGTHGFYLDRERMTIRFDAVINFDIPVHEAMDTLEKELTTLYPQYTFSIQADPDLS